MCDKLVFDLAQEVEGSPNVFVRKDWLNILDNQNQNYNNNQSVIDTSQLSNSNKYMSYREAYLSIPFLVTLASTSITNPTAQALVHTYSSGVYIDVYRVQGTISANTIIKGNTSNAQWNVSTSSDTATMDNAFEDIVDNNRVETEADAILDWTERNPFGEA